MFSLIDKKFRLAKVGLVRAACPRELMMSAANRSMTSAIVIVANKNGVGRVDSTGYTPKCIVAAGAARRARLLDNGIVLSWAYVQDGAGMEIRADHEIGCSELLVKLGDLVNERMVGASAQSFANLPGGCPWIMEVYPFEGYSIFQYKGQKYRQAFALDPVERIVGLSGEPVKVDEKFVDAATQTTGGWIPRNQTGARYAYAPPQSALSYSTGGKDSELISQVFRNWRNITEAAAMYVAYAKASQTLPGAKPMRPAFAPVSLTDDGKILAQLNARGPGVFDFAVWSAGEQEKEPKTKSHGGDDVPMDQHAYVGDKNDTSTWHLPVDTPGRARAALARINQTQGIPANKKAGVLHKVQRAAKKHGVDVGAPSSGQKQWMKHKVIGTWSDEAREAAREARQSGMHRTDPEDTEAPEGMHRDFPGVKNPPGGMHKRFPGDRQPPSMGKGAVTP